MSAEVISLADHSKEGWATGQARCIGCGHKWVAVAKAGTTWLECPSCKAMKGIYQFTHFAPEGEQVWVCNCGSDVLFATPKALRCCGCGATQKPFD